jgi:hypothetical protein
LKYKDLKQSHITILEIIFGIDMKSPFADLVALFVIGYAHRTVKAQGDGRQEYFIAAFKRTLLAKHSTKTFSF